MTRVTIMSGTDKPGYRKSHFTARAKTYTSQQRKYKYENHDGLGSTRVVVHNGFSLDVWDYHTERAVRAHKAERKLNNTVLVAGLGICIIDAILNS